MMQVPYETAHQELLDVIKQRDEARSLADQLAFCIFKVMPDEPESYRTEAYEEWMDTWSRCARGLVAWETRDWAEPPEPTGIGFGYVQ